MTHKTVLNPYKPLLKSYYTNTYEKLYLESQIDQNQYYLNQSEEFWDILVTKHQESLINDWLTKQNRPLNLQEYKNLFSSKVNIQHFEQNSEVLNKIYEDISKLYGILSKLDEIGLSYSLDITGGAARDFINNKPIKDIDIMLSIFDTYENKTILRKMTDISFLKKHFNLDAIVVYVQDLMSSNLEHNEDFILKKQQLMTLCFYNVISEKFTFTSSNRAENDETEYDKEMLKNNRLLGVFKLSQEKMQLHYPMDILLTDFRKIEFIKDFDLDICKVSFSLVNSVYKTQFPQTALELISRFTAEIEFWADVHNKKITMNVDNMSHKNIENSLTKHYQRIQEKYSDYELNIIASINQIENLNYAKNFYANEIIKA